MPSENFLGAFLLFHLHTMQTGIYCFNSNKIGKQAVLHVLGYKPNCRS